MNEDIQMLKSISDRLIVGTCDNVNLMCSLGDERPYTWF